MLDKDAVLRLLLGAKCLELDISDHGTQSVD